MTPPVRNILVVVLDNLGDTVMATAVLRPLKRLFPQASVGLFVKGYAGEMLADHSLIERVHAADPFWDRSPGRGRGAVADFVETLYGVRRVGYDVALVLNAEWRRALATRLAGIPVRVGFDRRRARRFLTKAVPETGAGAHFIDGHRAVLRAFAGEAVDGEEFLPRLEVPEGDRLWWDAWSARTGFAAGTYIVAHPFSGDERKNWPLGAWVSLIERLQPQGHRFVLVCSAAERARLGAAIKSVPADSVQVMAGAPLRHVKAVIAKSRLLVGGDSGPGHMAAALGVPVVSLFGPGAPARSGPVGRAAVKFVTHDPLSTLSLDVVASAVTEALESRVVGGNA